MRKLLKGEFVLGSPVIILDLEGHDMKFLLDTGFNGEVMLPEHLIEELSLTKIGTTDCITVSGDVRTAEVYLGKLTLLGEHKEVEIISTPSIFSLAGMELFHTYKLTIERHKGKLEIK